MSLNLTLTKAELDVLLFAVDEGMGVASLRYYAAKENMNDDVDVKPYCERVEVLQNLLNRLLELNND